MVSRKISGEKALFNDWKFFLLLSLIVFAIAFGLRCIDLPKWANPDFSFNGEYIMGTHDAYFWLAGATGVGSAVNNPMSELLAMIANLTGMKLGNIAFWLPAVFAGLTSVAAFGWGLVIAGPWAGLVAGVFVTSVPAYYFRTRLSYYDTDLVTLMFPLLISLLMTLWIKPLSKANWIANRTETYFRPGPWSYLFPIIAGCITMFGDLWHSDVQIFGLAVALISFFLAVFFSHKGVAKISLRGVLLFSLTAFWGLGGLAVSCVLAYLWASERVKISDKVDSVPVYLVVFIACIAFSQAGASLFGVFLNKFLSYTKSVSDTQVSGNGPVYPGIAQSVIEAQNVSLKEFFGNVVGNSTLGWIGFITFFLCLSLVPCSLFLAPFALASLAAVVMGGRFAMFGGVPVGIGIGFFVTWVVDRFLPDIKSSQLVSACLALIAIGSLVFGNYVLFTRMPVTPVLYRQHVEGLIKCKPIMEPGSTVWTWWDWGYATTYYTGQNVFANGGNHAGPVLYPLALAYATPSYLQSSQFIKYCALNGNNPANAWAKLSSNEVLELLRSLGASDQGLKPSNKQYLVVSWKDITLAHWILYYGAWNVQSGTSFHPNFGLINMGFKMDYSNGVMLKRDGTRMDLASYNILDSGSVKIEHFPGRVGPNLVFNAAISQGFLMDDFSYSSMLVKLLLIDPASDAIAPYFKLIYEGTPYVRIFEVK